MPLLAGMSQDKLEEAADGPSIFDRLKEGVEKAPVDKWVFILMTSLAKIECVVLLN